MNQLLKSRLFQGLIFLILFLLLLFLIMLIRPLLHAVYQFLGVILTPFLIATVISYILNPFVTILHERKIPRGVAVLLIYSLFIIILIVTFMNVTPMFVDQMNELNEHMPDFTMRMKRLLEQFNHDNVLPDVVQEGIDGFLVTLERAIEHKITAFLSNISAIMNALFIAMIVPFLAFYMLKDLDLFERAAFQYLPRASRKPTMQVLKDIDTALGCYIRGQLLVSLAIGILAYGGYLLIKLPFPGLNAAFVAVFDIIPYLGPFFGVFPALIVATTISWKMILLVLLVNIVCQNLESNVISPQIVGKSMNVHPLTLVLVLLIGGELAGILGMVAAVPLYAALKVIVHHIATFYIKRKIASKS